MSRRQPPDPSHQRSQWLGRGAVGLVVLGLAALAAWPWNLAIAAIGLLLWVAGRPPRRELVGGLVVAGIAVCAAWLVRDDGAGSRWQASAEREYDALWSALERAADQGVERLASPSRDDDQLYRAFLILREIVAEELDGRGTLLLLEPDGEPKVWVGEGLVNDVEESPPLVDGRTFLESFTASTALVTRSLGDDGARAWRLVAGRSFARSRPPVRVPGGGGGQGPRWWFTAEPEPPVEGRFKIDRAATPSLVLDPGLLHPPRGPTSLVAPTIAVLLIWVLLVRRGRKEPVASLDALLATLFALNLALALGVGVPALVGSTVAVAVAAFGLGARSHAYPLWVRAGAGVSGVVAVFAAAWWLQVDRGPLDLSSELLPDAEVALLRVALAALFAGIAGMAAGRSLWTGSPVATSAPPARALDEVPETAWVRWAGLGAVLGGAALPDVPLAAASLSLVGAGAVTALLGVGPSTSRWQRIGTFALLAALVSASAAQTTYRWRLNRHVGGPMLEAMAPPTPAEIESLKQEVEASLTSSKLPAVLQRGRRRVESGDFAFALWRESPLNRAGLLSALTVEPAGRPRSTFSFGLPMTRDGRPDRSPVRWSELELPVWEASFVSGRVALQAAGETIAVVRYWAAPRPGGRLTDRAIEDLAEGLLRGVPGRIVAGSQLTKPALYALFDLDGRAALSPFVEAVDLPESVRNGGSGMVRTPIGPARAHGRLDRDGLEVLFLPRLAASSALENAGVHATFLLALLAGLFLVAAVFTVTPAAARLLANRLLYSYSRRLLVVYTLLLGVPLLLLNIVVLRQVDRRLEREQLLDGRAALDSAQRLLGEFIYELEPGFGLDTALDDKVLTDVSRVVHHEVNLYWESSVYTSSLPGLFTAGLLPDRIPGEIYSRLALLGEEIASRQSRTGERTYLEIYAPLRIPGQGLQEKLFLSVPLLAQQEELAEQFASLRRRVMLVTGGLFLVLTAVGSRLAQRFTKPLMELVAGTQRIAAGATRLGIAPTDVELAALGGAIDEMAQRIARGRASLLREKQLVERMVDNITSGILSIDDDGRVMLRNQVAGDLLGVDVGDLLVEKLGADERLSAIGEFVERSGAQTEQRTIRVRPAEDELEREWTVIWVPLPGGGEPRALLVVEDSTEVLRAQRLEAWAEMARMIAHEIKNPLTPIRLSTEHLQQVQRDSPERLSEVFETCTRNILTQVEELRQIASDFSVYARIPEIHLADGDLVETVRDVVDGYLAAGSSGVAVALHATEPSLPARFDARMLSRGIRNLLENALRACAAGGQVEVVLARQGDRAVIEVADDGPGVEPAKLARIFEPYFSTHASGTGLGLPICRRIVEEHGGTIEARNREGGGLRLTIDLPLDGRSAVRAEKRLRPT